MKRFPDMTEEKFCILSVLVVLIAVAHSNTIFRPLKKDSSENAGKEEGIGSNSRWDPPHLGVPDLGINRLHDPSLPEYDANANEIDNSISGGEPDGFIPDLDHDELPNDYYEGNGEDVDRNVDDYHGFEETLEGGIDNPFAGEDDLKESLGGKDDPEEPVLGGKDDPEEPVLEGKDDPEEPVLGEKDDPEEPVLGGKDDPEEPVLGGKDDPEEPVTGGGVDDKRGFEGGLFKPGFGGGGFFGGKETGPGFLGGPSIFDTPFFNLEQVRKYFHQMERALEHVFKETVDEALLLNGTYANTTEEEVDINGKKYTVLKSILKGRDNHTSIYVETLSSKPKGEGGEEGQSKKV